MSQSHPPHSESDINSERQAAAERAQRIAICKARKGRVEKQPDPEQTGRDVWVGSAGARYGETRPMATENDAWDALCEKMALLTPGESRIVSCHFGERTLGFVPLRGGREMVPLINQTRLEVRELGPENFQVFSVESVHSEGPDSKARDSIDCLRLREGDANGPYVFVSLGEAAGHLGKVMDRHRAAEREAAREEALNAGRELDRQPPAARPQGLQR
ncbi:hypothetical protein BX589_101104 [Paraburkholderia fungorum]|nr:hypothetical protein BX589_101104 [Paraburkholderia fungorum]